MPNEPDNVIRVCGHLAGKLLDSFALQFRNCVIERWTRQRARAFFERFCSEVEKETAGTGSESLDDLLTTMLADETCSEALFDAYRSVCLSKSKDLGPRVIAVLTAELVLQHREASQEEQNMLSAAEALTDEELLAFSGFVRENRIIAKGGKGRRAYYSSNKEHIAICEGKEQIDSSWHRNEEVSRGPLDLKEAPGFWACKSKAHGLLSDDVKEKEWDYREDSERHIDEPGTVREFSWWVYVPTKYFKFADIIDRVANGLKATR